MVEGAFGIIEGLKERFQEVVQEVEDAAERRKEQFLEFIHGDPEDDDDLD